MDTAGALEHQELMSEGKDLRLQRCSSLKGLPSRRNQRENDGEHVAEKLQRRLPKFNQFSQNGVFGRDRHLQRLMVSYLLYYHEDRTHLGLAKDTPAGRVTEIRSEPGSKIQSLPRLGGLHHRYAVAA